MKGRIFLVDETPTLRRAALVIDGRLEALEIDVLGDETPQWGSIYNATVTERMTAMGAAFVDLAGQRGFLPDAGDLLAGAHIKVQVRREAEGDKAARVSTDLQIEHRLIVHTPIKPGINVSKKIADPEERQFLKTALADFEGGFVIRTAAQGSTATALEEIAASLELPYIKGPGLIRSGPDALARLRLRFEDADIETTEACFDHHDIEPQIDILLQPRVDLPGGAWMTIEPTTALIAVDINTGASRSGDALARANLDATSELPRQISLRRLGGAIAIDFAGGPQGKARRRLESQLTAATEGTSLRSLGWGPAGWLELQARKPGRSLSDLMQHA